MAFTRSLLIKALSGVAGVGGATVGVLASTGVFTKKEQGGKGSTDAQENNKRNTQQDSQPGVDDREDNVERNEDRSTSTSQISEPGSSNNPVQVEDAGNVDPKPQSTNPPNSRPAGETATTTSQVEEKQKASVVNTGVTESQQSTPTIQESPNTAPAGQPDGDGGDSNLPNTGSTPRTEDAQELGTGDDGAVGGGSSRSPDSSTTNTPTQSQEAKINEKLKTLGVPESCNFSQNETTKTCSIPKEELKKMKFEESGDDGVDSEEKSIQLKIEILSENKKTAYGLNDDDGEENNLLFTLSGFKNSIEITHGGSNVVYPNTNPEFKVEGSELVKVWGKHCDLAEKVGIKKEENSSPYKFESTTTLKYSLDSGVSIKTLNSPTTSGTIDVEGDKENYNQGVKVTFGGKVTGTGADSLEKGDYEIKYDETQGWYLSKKNEGTEGKGSQGADGGGSGTDDPNSLNSQQPPQPDGSPSPDGLSSGQQLDNNQQEQVPTEDTNSLPRTDASESTQTITENQNSRVNDVSDTVDNEGDTATNSKLEKLKIPKKCRFTDINKDEPLECSLSKDEFKEISFEDKEVDENLLEENDEPFVMKLIIERLSESKKTDYENKTDLLFTFKDFKEKIENGCKRGFKVNKDLTFYENTNPEFEGNSENFKSLWGQPLDLAKKVGLSEASCNGNGNGSSCVKFKQTHDNPVQSTKFSVDKGNTIKEVNIPEESQQKAISFSSARGYSQGFRFLFKEDVIFNESNTLPAGGYEIVYKNDNGWYLSRVSESTEENWNEKDSDGKLCVSEGEKR